MQRQQVGVLGGLLVCVFWCACFCLGRVCPLRVCHGTSASECIFVHMRTPSKGEKEKKNGAHSCRGFAGESYTHAHARTHTHAHNTQSVLSVLIIMVWSNAVISTFHNNNQDGPLRT